jgi:hypothetical protein
MWEPFPARIELRLLRERLHVLERIEIARQRESIVYLEKRMKEMLRLRSQVATALRLLESDEVDTARRRMVEVLEGWPSR